MINQRNKIIDKINKDLNIRKIEYESDNTFSSRIIYSSLSLWIRMATCSITNEVYTSENGGKSKSSIINKVTYYFQNILKLYPEISEWFYPDKLDENPIITIINTLVECGEIRKVGFNTDLMLPKFDQCHLSNNKYIYMGFRPDGYEYLSGLIPFFSLSELDDMEDNVFLFYGIEDKNSSKVLENYLKSAKWNRIEESNYKIFDMHCDDILSNCWKDNYQLSDSEITLYKNEFYDYGFIKKISGVTFISQINKYLIEKYEIRRFMYAMRNNMRNPAKASYERYIGTNTVELNLFSGLPQREESLLFLFGWPKNNIKDKYNFIFHNSIWFFIEAIIGNLNIVLEERK